MKTIIKIAWRNLWRNKLRTGVLLVSIILGLWGGIFFIGMIEGMNSIRISSAIDTYLGHIQIYNKKYVENPELEFFVSSPEQYLKRIKQSDFVTGYATRLTTGAMASSAKASYPVKLVGIEPAQEKTVSVIPKQLIDGTYLEKFKKPSLVIGEKLADKLGLKKFSKLKISFSNPEGDILSYAFRVEGIYKINNSRVEKSNVFIKQSDLKKLLGLKPMQFNEIVIKTNTIHKVEQYKKAFEGIDNQNLVQTWDEIDPELGYAQDMMMTFTWIFMGIIMVALGFGIINAMLMAILERKRELGIMMAIGFNKKRLFWMIVIETLFLIAIATPVGLLLSYETISYFGEHGLKLTGVEQGMEAFGIGSVIYMDLPAKYYLAITILTVSVSFLAALYPAYKALQIQPVDAIREI